MKSEYVRRNQSVRFPVHPFPDMRSTLSFPALVPIFLAALSSPVLAGVQEIWWNITYVQNASPDGLFERRVIGVNNTWP